MGLPVNFGQGLSPDAEAVTVNFAQAAEGQLHPDEGC